jgi:hypothetical protein
MIDLLRMCRSYGLLPNREMIKYIRAVVLADGLVSRLAPGLDYGTKLAKLCEDYITSEVQSQILSPEFGLTFLADLSGWLQEGPTSILRALELLKRRQLRVQAYLTQRERGSSVIRLQALSAGAVWFVVAISLGLGWKRASTSASLLPVYVAVVFLVLWSGWLIYLLWRLAKNIAANERG